ncbi:uncharacterized protein LOC126579612 isoform X2 [Anopheles aquasalis]|uniref:uncharacterized protein LOC126579612 isoform X2 n=1 Tax=Anopheles aquasalis TaxID=42839 RepID=UPI00215B5276|nr:uncharacterized protein LOC126579612 isoform X2 [Anopheles aquasalis]
MRRIKFRLDEMGDIIWYNDLVNTTSNQHHHHHHNNNNNNNNSCSSSSSSSNNNNRNGTGTGAPAQRLNSLDGSAFCPIADSTAVLFSCETFEVVELPSSAGGPGLIFGAYTGHSIEFRTSTYSPRERMALRCDGWCQLSCQRVKDDQSVGQEEPFTLLSVLNDGNFCDVTLKSSDNVIYNVHSPILRLNGFDCSSMTAASTYQHLASRFECAAGRDAATDAQSAAPLAHPPLMKVSSVPCARTVAAAAAAATTYRTPPRLTVGHPSAVSVSAIATPGLDVTGRLLLHAPPSCFSLNPNLLLPPPSLDAYNLSPKQVTNISNSFNCLSAASAETAGGGGGSGSDTTGSIFLDVPRRIASCSDSNLSSNRNVFYFPEAAPATQANANCRVKFKSPVSPGLFRARSPSPFPSSTLDTPPSSPLTPLSVLNHLPSSMLATILHWLYCECLPEQLDEDTCIQLINMCESTTPLARMSEPCKHYLRNLQLKKFVVDIISDLHASLNHLIQLVNPGSISRSPCVLCQVFKEGVKETLIAIVKLLQFCNIFTKDATTFTRQQRHEIIKYVRTRMPIYLSQIHQLLQNVHQVLGGLTQEDRNDLVSYLVPEITAALELLTAAVSEIKHSLEKVCKDLKGTTAQQQQHQEHQDQAESSAGCRGGPNRPGARDRDATARSTSGRSRNSGAVGTGATGERLGARTSTSASSESDLRFFLYMYEVKKMRDIYGRVTSALEVLLHKKGVFNEMNLLHQHQTVRRNLDQLAVEVPAAIGQLEELCDTIDEKIGWKEFKFCFKFLTSQVNGIMSKLLEHKSALNDAMLYVSTLVQKEAFTYALVELGLLDRRSVDPGLLQECAQRRSAVRSSAQRRFEYASVKVNLVQNLCEPPTAAHSSLSKNALKLLHSGQLADMEFEVVVPPPSADQHGGDQTDGTTVSTTTTTTTTTTSDYSPDGLRLKAGSGLVRGGSQSHCFKAHRVMVAARCDWFRKALLSGMQEDINRKIAIYDTSPVIFRRLLLYLYGAPVDKSVGVDQLCELMLLADRYSVDNLKAICEETLVATIDGESVIYLYGISDRFNAAALQASCLSYLSQHTELTQLDIFQELPVYLQNEVHELIRWCGRVPEPWCDRTERSRSDRTRHSLKSPSKSSSRSSHSSRKTSPSFM